MATRQIKDAKGNWVEVEESVLLTEARYITPWYTRPELWAQIATLVGMLFAGWQATAAKNNADDARAIVKDVKKEVQAQAGYTGRPLTTAKEE